MPPSATPLIALLSTLLLGCAAPGHNAPSPDDPLEALGAKPIDTATFSSVIATCTCFVDIKVGPTHHVEVVAREEVLADVKVEVDGDTLRLQYYPSSTKYARDPVRFEVTLPSLNAVEAKAVTNATIAGVTGRDLAVSADGASRVSVAGKVETLHVELHNQAKLDARALQATDVDVTIDGSGEAEVNARELLRASVYRFGKVWYVGEPKALDVDHGRRRVRQG